MDPNEPNFKINEATLELIKGMESTGKTVVSRYIVYGGAPLQVMLLAPGLESSLINFLLQKDAAIAVAPTSELQNRIKACYTELVAVLDAYEVTMNPKDVRYPNAETIPNASPNPQPNPQLNPQELSHTST